MGTLKIKTVRGEASPRERQEQQEGEHMCMLEQVRAALERGKKKKGKVVIFDSRMKERQLRNY